MRRIEDWMIKGFWSKDRVYGVSCAPWMIKLPYMPHEFFGSSWWWERDEHDRPVAYFDVDGSLIRGEPEIYDGIDMREYP